MYDCKNRFFIKVICNFNGFLFKKVVGFLSWFERKNGFKVNLNELICKKNREIFENMCERWGILRGFISLGGVKLSFINSVILVLK